MAARSSTGKIVSAGIKMIVWRCAALGCSALSSIWIARSLGPTKLGVSTSVTAVVGMLAVPISFPANSFLVRQYKTGNDYLKSQLLVCAVTIRALLSVGCVVAASIALLAGWIPLGYRLAVMAGMPLIIATSLSPAWLLQAQERQPAQYLSGFVGAAASAVCAVCIIRTSSPAGADVIISAVATFCAAALMWASAGYYCFWRLISIAKTRQISGALVGHSWMYWTALVMYLYASFDIPLVGLLLPVDELGKYRTATMLTSAGSTFLAMVPTLIYPRFIAIYKEDRKRLWAVQKRLAKYIGIAVIITALAVAVVSRPLFQLVYGREYVGAATPFAILAASKLIVVLNGIFAWGLWTQGRDRTMFMIMVVCSCLTIAANLILIPRWRIVGAASANLGAEFFILVATYVACKRQQSCCSGG